MSEAGLFKIKPPPITIPPQPPAPPIPPFDYIIDIYSNKVVVTDASGNTTELPSISDLNNWLKNITGKRIRINVNVEIYDNLFLTPNEYWVFGEWMHGDIYLTGKNITIVSFTRLGDKSYRGFISNYNPQARGFMDVSGLKLYSVYAELDIHGKADMVLRDVLIYVEQTYESFIEYVVGDVYMRGGYINITRSTLHNAYIEADYINLEDVTSSDYMGAWVMITRYAAWIQGTVNAKNTLEAMLYIRHSVFKTIDANSSLAIDLPTVDYWFVHYRLVFIGVRKGSNPYYYDPLPSGVTWYFDEVNKKIVINNATSNPYNIVLMYEVTTMLPLY